jgi:hypothetical protein
LEGLTDHELHEALVERIATAPFAEILRIEAENPDALELDQIDDE